MQQHRNVQRIEQEYRAFCAGDFEAIGGTLSERAVWHVGGGRRSSGDYKGREEIVRFLRSVARECQQDFMIEIHDILANDDHTVVLAHTTLHRDEAVYTADEVHVYRTDPDGLIVEAWGFTADPEGQGAFWF